MTHTEEMTDIEIRWHFGNMLAALRAIEHETGMTMLATNHGRRGDIANAIARAAIAKAEGTS